MNMVGVNFSSIQPCCYQIRRDPIYRVRPGRNELRSYRI